MLNSSVLTDAGRRWLTRALDPFHDTEVQPAGYPDFEQSATVVQEVNMSVTLTCPPSVASGTWDAHIFNAPHFASREEATSQWATYNANNGQVAPIAIYMPDSGVIAMAVSSTEGITLPDTVLTAVSSLAVKAVNPYQFLSSKTRVVGYAFEVVNTTAPLYKQGSVIAYRMPQLCGELMWAKGFTTTTSALNVVIPTVMDHYAMPPSTPSEAIALPSSKMWDAAKGFYGVCTMTNETNTMQSFNNKKFVWLPNGTPTSGVTGAVTSTNPTVSGDFTSFQMTNRWFAPYNTTGAYFTGLSKETTLQVNVKYLLESAPGPRSPLVTLAHQSPSYDGEAIRLYTLLVARMPVGVPFDENPAGEWFQTILGLLGQAAMVASPAHPLLGILGGGLDLASKLVPKVAKLLGDRYGMPAKKPVIVIPNLPVGQRKSKQQLIARIRKGK